MSDSSTGQTLEIVRSRERPGDPTSYTYRGARITAWKASHGLHLTDHPYDGQFFGNTPHIMLLIDWWLDKARMPPGYVWSALPGARTKAGNAPGAGALFRHSADGTPHA